MRLLKIFTVVGKEEMILKKMFFLYGVLMVLDTKVYSNKNEKSVKLFNFYKQFENMLLNYSEQRKGIIEERRQETFETKTDMKWAYRGR